MEGVGTASEHRSSGAGGSGRQLPAAASALQQMLRPHISPSLAAKMSRLGGDPRAPLGGSAVYPSGSRSSPGTPRPEAWSRGGSQPLEAWTPAGYPPLARRTARPAMPGAACPASATAMSPSTPTISTHSPASALAPASPASRWPPQPRRPAQATFHDQPRTPQKVPEIGKPGPDVADDTPPKGSKPIGQSRRQPCDENCGYAMLARTVAHRKLPQRKGDSPVARPTSREPLQDLTNLTGLRRNHSDILQRPQKSTTAAVVAPGIAAAPSLQAPAEPPQVRRPLAGTPPAPPSVPQPQPQPQRQQPVVLPAPMSAPAQAVARESPGTAPQLQWPALPAPARELSAQALEPLRDFSVVARRYGAAAAARSLEEMPTSVRHALNFIKLLPNLPCTASTLKALGVDRQPLLPPRPPEEPPRPTLVLDLDETLVHCSREGKGRPRCQAEQNTPPDLVIEFEVTPTFGNVFFRPFVQLFLEVAARSFEIVVFTASQQAYADQVINALDPTGAYIKHRLYRQHCTESRGAYFKELGLLGRPLGQCILVDNSPISVACNADHGVLIQSWYGDKCDRELVDLLAVLQDLQLRGGDVDRYLAGRYGLREFFEAMRQGAATS